MTCIKLWCSFFFKKKYFLAWHITTKTLIIYLQKWLTCRIPLQKSYFTGTLKKCLSETLVWPDFTGRKNENRTHSCSWKWPPPYLFPIFFFKDFSHEICSCSSLQVARKSGCKVTHKKSFPCGWKGLKILLEAFKKGRLLVWL